MIDTSVWTILQTAAKNPPIPKLSYNPRGPFLAIVYSAHVAFACRLAALGCGRPMLSPRNRGRRLTKIGAMYKYTLAESSLEGARVWEHTCKHKVCLSASTDVGELERGTREPKEREYKENGRSTIHIYVRYKSRQNVLANQPISSNPLLQIQTSIQRTCDPVRYHHTTVSCNRTKYWISPQFE